MKAIKVRWGVVAAVLLRSSTMTWATTVNDELIEEVTKKDAAESAKQLQIMQENLQFSTFKSCDDMQQVVEKFLKDNADRLRSGGWWGGRPMPLMMEWGAADGAKGATTSTPPADSRSAGTDSVAAGMWWWGDFSQTNIQVAGVDEPDILKSDGVYLYYYNQRLSAVFIIKAPVQWLAPVVVSKIAVPQSFQNIQLLLDGKRLALLSQRWREVQSPTLLDTASRVDVAVYDVENPAAPKLNKLAEFPGYYADARLYDGKIYVVSQLGVNRWMAWDGVAQGWSPVFKADSLLPKQVDISYTKNESAQNLAIGKDKFPYRVSVDAPGCENVYYTFPTKETMERMGISPQFTTIQTVNLRDTEQKPTTTVALGAGQTIHMSTKNLYVTSPFYVAGNFTCPINARCLLPSYWGGEQTLVHKFSLQPSYVRYEASALVQWAPLNQRSMDEDTNGYFRIITKHRMPEQATDLYVLDSSLKMHGSLTNIEPKEDFKASRYIGDKLYLVTYEQIDPLFVIDLANSAAPKIVGKLVIPGYSSYLHPYAPMENGIQYLIGLWYDTKAASRWWTTTAGIKIDLYKVDYKTLSSGKIDVKQVASTTLGDQGSWSEAQYNSRVFVWDGARKQLSLPMVLAKQEETQSCTINYDKTGKEIGKQCYPNYVQSTVFAGIKILSITPDKEIKEVASRDYKDKFTRLAVDGQGNLQPWFFQSWSARVWYMGTAPYIVTTYFVDGLQNSTSFVPYDDSLSKRPDQCVRNKPTAGEPTCDMYCWKRRVRQNDKCEEVDVTSGCTCPWYDTKEMCERVCK